MTHLESPSSDIRDKDQIFIINKQILKTKGLAGGQGPGGRALALLDSIFNTTKNK
jgi:hypothetical protein